MIRDIVAVDRGRRHGESTQEPQNHLKCMCAHSMRSQSVGTL